MPAPIRILIVDDDALTRSGVALILASEPDFQVVGEAADAATAYSLIAELAPDVVLMDVQLPGVDGIDATLRITTRPGHVPKVIVLTTFDLDSYVYRSMQAGSSGFLLKRVQAEELIDAVRAVADGGALPAPARTTELISKHALVDRARARFVPPLTDRETQVLVLLARGRSNQEIASELTISLETVRTHVKHVYAKCGATDRAHAVIAAYESGLVGPHPPG